MEFVRMKKYLFMMMGAMLMVMSAGCSSDDDTLTLGNKKTFSRFNRNSAKPGSLSAMVRKTISIR